MYVLGTLNQDHRDAFEEIVLGMEPAAQTVVPVVEEETPTLETLESDEILMEDEAREFLRGIKAGVSRELSLVDSSDILEGGSDETGLEALGMNLSFEVETTDSRVPYELTLTLHLDENELELDVEPKTFEYSIDRVKVSLKNKSEGEIAKHIVRLLNDFEGDLVEMVSPGSERVNRPKTVGPSRASQDKKMSKEGAKNFLEDVIKSLGKNKRIEDASQPMHDGAGVASTIRFNFETATGNTPYDLTLTIEGDVITANVLPEVFEGNIQDKRMTLDSSLTSELVAKSLVALLSRYEDGLDDMMSF